jgi:proteasome lid subunit RPN8/RPN11
MDGFLSLGKRMLPMPILIRRNAILSALAGARAANPNEFVCLLRGRRKKGDLIIEDTLIPPGIMTSETMTSFSDWMLPYIEGLVGTFHSHPGGSTRPSQQDRHLFSQKGGVNFIAAEPFGLKDVSAYLGNGKKAEFTVID